MLNKLISEIFNNKYYTNHGPLAQKLEETISARISIKHCISITNLTIANLILDVALGNKPTFPPQGDYLTITYPGALIPITANILILHTKEEDCIFICTNNDQLAEKIRNIRSSYGIREKVDVPITGNGRVSELQAALGLEALK